MYMPAYFNVQPSIISDNHAILLLLLQKFKQTLLIKQCLKFQHNHQSLNKHYSFVNSLIKLSHNGWYSLHTTNIWLNLPENCRTITADHYPHNAVNNVD